MICFEFLRSLEKNRKKGKPRNLGKHELLRCSVGNPRRGEAGVPKWHPLGYAMTYPCYATAKCYAAT